MGYISDIIIVGHFGFRNEIIYTFFYSKYMMVMMMMCIAIVQMTKI